MMKRIYLFLMIACAFSLSITAQPTTKHHVGLSLEGGYSHLFFGHPLTPFKPLGGLGTGLNASLSPLSGGGGGAALYYELQHGHFIFRTGFGFDASYNRNRLIVPEHFATIEEYPNMLFHYQFDRFEETTTYGIAYLPIYLGGSWNRFFFLAGAKIGVLPFAAQTTAEADVKIWAEDPDIIGPIEDLPTHGLQTSTFTGQPYAYPTNPINAMLSLEMGINLDKPAPEPTKRMDREERWRELHRKRSLKELTHYRVSFFADYGFTDIRRYEPNPIPFGNMLPEGGLVAFASVSDIQPYSMLGCAPLKQAKLNNFMFGVKFAVQFEIPKRAPRKGSMANPFIYAYVEDQLTEKPIANARVQVSSTKHQRQRFDRTTDAKFGRVGKSMPPGEYRVQVSRPGYFPDSLVFMHEERFDTLFIALYPERNIHLVTTDAKSGRRISAFVTIQSEEGEQLLAAQLDSAAADLSTMLDGRKRYYICARADGYIDMCDTITDLGGLKTLKLEPKVVRRFVLQNMFFATDKTKILPSSEPALNELYMMLRDNPELRIKIIGHTDDIASDAYNQRLSEGRAHSVRKEMIERGIDGSRILTEGHGELDPIVPNDTEEHRQMNRRVEIEILEQ